MDQRYQRLLAALGLGLGGVLGMAGSFAPTDALRGLAWGIDGVSLVIASALLVVIQIRNGRDLLAAGFLVFAIGQGLVLSTAAVAPAEAAPTFGAGAGLWAAGLALVSAPSFYPVIVRLLGFAAAILLAIVAVQIFIGVHVAATSSPLPFFAYPVLVATMVGWIWSLLRTK
ncbi:MAG TPA: hypothetical protein VG943_04585 [Caulobacterales bacterium]|nr:hypothetical protein [Caulobacterales bacterium]